MYKVIEKRLVGVGIYRMTIAAPRAAKGARPGQFVMIMADEKGERIPLTIFNSDALRGAITVIFQEAGKTTRLLARITAGDAIANVTGPLGRPTMVGRAGRIIFIAGGVGIAEVIPIARYAKALGNKLTAIIGARTKKMVMLENELKEFVGKLIVATDDGSYGEKGLVTTALKKILKKETFDLAYCVGPDKMMQSVCEATAAFGLKTIVSLDANMVDATGMCGTCRVMVAGETKFTCVDGPEFDGHKVDFPEFIERQRRFRREEKISLENFEKECACRGPLRETERRSSP